MNKSTLITLTVISLSLIGLFVLVVTDNNKKLNEGRAKRMGTPVIDSLIAINENMHPVINNKLKGKTILINVWATWCQPCKKEIPELNQLVYEYGNRDDIVFIALSAEDSSRTVERMQEMGLNFDYELYFNQQEMINHIYDYKLDQENRAIPVNIVINSEGKLEFYYLGYHPDKLEEVRTYLASKL